MQLLLDTCVISIRAFIICWAAVIIYTDYQNDKTAQISKEKKSPVHYYQGQTDEAKARLRVARKCIEITLK